MMKERKETEEGNSTSPWSHQMLQSQSQSLSTSTVSACTPLDTTVRARLGNKLPSDGGARPRLRRSRWRA